MNTSQPSKPNQPILLAEMQVQFKIDGSLTSAPGRVVQRLRPSPFVTVEVFNVARNPQPSAQSSSGPAAKSILTFPLIMSEGPSMAQLESGMWIEVVPTSWFPHQQEGELRLQKSPSVVLDSGKPITRLQFDVLNITGSLFRWPLTLQAQSWLLRIDPVPKLEDVENALRADGGYAVTHRGIVQRTDGKGFSKDDAELFIMGLDHFLSFVCGTQCGTNNAVGFDAKENETWKQWGSYHVSRWKPCRTWADVTVVNALSVVFAKFWDKFEKSPDIISRILRLYTESNASNTIDVSIILTQTILEIFVSLKDAKGSNRGERIATMLDMATIDVEIPTSLENLGKISAEYGWSNGPHALVEIRNSLIHANSKYGTISIGAYSEAKQLGLWYVELLLLRMFEYDGEYASRLVDVQRVGNTELVPWAKGC